MFYSSLYIYINEWFLTFALSTFFFVNSVAQSHNPSRLQGSNCIHHSCYHNVSSHNTLEESIMSSTKQTTTTPRRRNAFRAVTCGALCMTLIFHMPTPNATYSSTDSLRGNRKNFSKEDIVASNLTASTVRQHVKNNTKVRSMDFLVAGFAKCGTTTLLKTFEAHNETAVAPKEECSLDVIENNAVARATVMRSLSNASSSPNVKRGIKCPFTFTSDNSLQRLEQWFPDTKVIYGLRHPVHYFESYFNYRVLAFHSGKIKGPIPPAERLLHSNEWERVSTDSARFETILRQLVSTDNEEAPLKFPVFLYTLEQMKDEKENEALRETLGSFLELQHPIQPVKKANVNKNVGDNGYRETIDICDIKYKELRSVLVANGDKTQQWIRDKLLPHATVANRESFVKMLKQWGQDPCDMRHEEEAKEVV